MRRLWGDSSHGCREAGAAGGQCGQRYRLPEAGAPGHADRSAAGDHTPEEALPWSVYWWPAPHPPLSLRVSLNHLTTRLSHCLIFFFLSVCLLCFSSGFRTKLWAGLQVSGQKHRRWDISTPCWREGKWLAMPKLYIRIIERKAQKLCRGRRGTHDRRGYNDNGWYIITL